MSPRSLRMLAALTTLLLSLGTLPALASEGEAAETTTGAEDDGGHLNGKFLILLAEGFDTNEEEFGALVEMGFGFGDIFKLELYAAVLGVPVDELVAGATRDDETGEFDFAWGELRHSLTEEQLEALQSYPKNFGQLVSGSVRHDGAKEHESGQDRGTSSPPGNSAANKDKDKDKHGDHDDGDDDTGDDDGTPGGNGASHSRSGRGAQG